MTQASAALFYHPEAYTTSGPKLMGRNAAGQSFLKGFLAHAASPAFWALVDTPAHGEGFRAAVAAAGRSEPAVVLDRAHLHRLAEVGTLFYPGPDVDLHARRRVPFGAARWSLCGITHTTASAGAMDAITAMVSGETRPWDALIVTSGAVRAQVEALLAEEEARLAQRTGARQVVRPQMPVIPLGLDTADLATHRAHREAARAELGLAPDTVVVLFVGRLSFHAKAHPLAMYRALQLAARAGGGRRDVVLVECGWFANDYIEKAFEAASAAACPDVRVVRLDGRAAAQRRTAWAAADVFCSLSDNIQETFGLTPIEAMAAGLPVVVSDWDGYRDTVRDGIDGFRVPTLMAGPGLGGDLALRHALGLDTYDMYCGLTSALVAVDVEATAAAFGQLLASPELRRRMGEAGQARARQVYDWAAVIPRYQELWQQLAELRRAAPEAEVRPRPIPARPDPFASFAGYPTRLLGPDTVLEPACDGAVAEAWVAQVRELSMVTFATAVLPTEAEAAAVLARAAAGPVPARELVADAAPARRLPLLRSLAALVKLGVLRVRG